jgi:hypothetical protein
LKKHIAFLVFGAGIFLFAAFFVESPPPKPEPQTRWYISECYDGVAMLEAIRGQPLSTVLTSASLTVSLNTELAIALQPLAYSNWVSLNVENKGSPILDSWGSPLLIARRDDLRAGSNRFNARLLSASNDIVVWSSGPNSLNEMGMGDDICYDDSAAQKDLRRMRVNGFHRASE